LQPDRGSPCAEVPPQKIGEHIVEIVSDSGEGAQKAGQIFGTVSAKMGNGVWTVEIIPAEIKPPSRSRAGSSGIRIRLGSREVKNQGDEADLVVAFNEQVLYGRIAQGAYGRGTRVLVESKWAEDPDPGIREEYASALADFRERGYLVTEVPLEKACAELTTDSGRGKNMFVIGILAYLYSRDLDLTLREVGSAFRTKGEKTIETNRALARAGYEFAAATFDYRFEIPCEVRDEPRVVMNGNTALGFGIMAAGIEVVAMYPITPATSVSHYLAGVYPKVGGFLHQAEDEIAAIGFALGASYAGKVACTVTSGPGLALKMEFIGLAVMAEIPLVVIVVQRGGPSTGLPTKVEQGELLPAIFGSPGDDPKVVLAAATIEECLHFVVLSRRLAEAFRIPVILLSDASLATGVQPVPRVRLSADWLAPWEEGVLPYDWNGRTGISRRPIPGQPGGQYVLTGLAHTSDGSVAYDPESNQRGCEMRSRKLAALKKTLKPPKIHGAPEGDLLVVGWGSTLGSIEEAVDRARSDGHEVSSVHLRFLSPLEPGLREIFSRFQNVMTVEINYGDPPSAPLIDEQTRRRAQLAMLLRDHTLADVDSYSNVHGQPLRPNLVYQEIVRRVATKVPS
jgi:2-oxoglutarate ferredoxin oxidoreductase subunit alpha